MIIEKPKSYIAQEIDRLGAELVAYKKKVREAKSEESKKVYQERVDFFQQEFEKAKMARDRVKAEKEIREVQKKPQIKEQRQNFETQADIAENQPKIYGGKIYAKESAPEDAIEEGQKIKNIKNMEKFSQKIEEPKAELKEENLKMSETSIKKLSPEEKIIEKAKQGKKISEKDIEKWGEIKEGKVLSELEESEVRQLRLKKKIEKDIEEPLLSEEENKRVESMRLKLDIIRGGKEEEIKLNQEDEEKLEKESKEIEQELEKMPEEKREKISIGFKNIGFFVQEQKSRAMAWICEKAVIGGEAPIQEQGAVKRFLAGLAETYRKDEDKAKKQIEEREKSGDAMKRLGNIGLLTGNIMKYGRTVADFVGWTVGSPLRYVTMGAQFFSRGAEAAKEARLKNQEVIEKTRIKDIDEAAEEAWKIYEIAQAKASDKLVSKENLQKAYTENLPQDLLERLKKTEPGTATGILQKILKKDLEFAIKRGKVNEARLLEYDRMIGQYGTVDALALGAKYAETAGKAAIVGVQIESAYLLLKKMPDIIHHLSEIESIKELKSWLGVSEAAIKTDDVIPPEVLSVPQPEVVENIYREIGSRGPEGSIIDYLRENPDIAVEKFGASPEFISDKAADISDVEAFNKWAGAKAHELWLEHAKVALTDEEVLDKLGKLGYSKDMDGYLEMMKRIGKGAVEINPSTGEIDLTDMEYLKARPSMVDTDRYLNVEKDYNLQEIKLRSDIEGGLKNIGAAVEEPKIEFKEIKTFLEDKAKISVEKSSFLNEKFLDYNKVGEFLEQNFGKPHGIEAYTTAEPEYGSPQWWEMKEKVDLQNQIEKIVRSVPFGERAALKNLSLFEFFQKHLAR